MFNSKLKQLRGFSKQKTSVSQNTNAFIKEASKKSAETRSGNNALKYSTTGNDFLDQFSNLGVYKEPRDYKDIAKDQSTLWGNDPELAVKFIVYCRIITRKCMLFGGTKTQEVQRGAGLKHESIMRMIWLAINHPNVFIKNLGLFVSAGSWKDIFKMLQYDLVHHDWDGRQLNWNKIGGVIMSALKDDRHSNLVKKYLPTIKTNSKCNTIESQANNVIGKWICSLLYGTKMDDYKSYSKYRKLKSSGTAHEWQKLISQGKHELIDFNAIHGRALQLLVKGKYLENQSLEKAYESWIESQPVAKFTGYPYELFKDVNRVANKQYKIHTLNKQWDGLVQTAKTGAETATSLIVVRDTSASMNSDAIGTNVSSGNIAKSMALFFSEMLPDGYFANSWIEFNSDAKMHQWKGSTAYEKWTNDRASFVGSTNFLSVIKLICNIKRKGIAEDQFPSGILCISDGEFNRVSWLNVTNFSTARQMLTVAGFSKEYRDNFKIVLWDIPNNHYNNSSVKFETYGEHKNSFYMSGYDPAPIAFLTGLAGKSESTPQSAEELFAAAMDQEILNLVSL